MPTALLIKKATLSIGPLIIHIFHIIHCVLYSFVRFIHLCALFIVRLVHCALYSFMCIIHYVHYLFVHNIQ